jgi:colicin import membrane protein
VTYDDYVTDKERRVARWLAVAMHAAFVLLLVFGVAWQKHHTESAAIVDLWSTLPPQRPEAVPAPPRPAPKPEAKPEAKREPPPPPKPEAKPQPKPDIALKEKLEKERKLKEQKDLEKKKQVELQKRKEDEAKKLKTQQLEEKKKEDEKRKLERERAAQEAEAKRAAQEQADMKAKFAAQQAAAQAKSTDEYARQVRTLVLRHIVEPPALQGRNPQVEVEVSLFANGAVNEVRVVSKSGVPEWDAAVERAILKAAPFPPPDPVPDRKLKLILRPKQ